MIPSRTRDCQDTGWKKALAGSIRSAGELLRAVGLRPEQLSQSADDIPDFPMRIPHAYVARMRQGDPHDPLLRQVLALRAERDAPPGYSLDPVGDGPATTRPGLLQKYHGRALIVTTGACPVHCRYCFRRHFPYGEAQAGRDDWSEVIAHIAGDSGLGEVILSGGDPLSLDTARLQRLSDGLSTIPHLRRLRIHTRMPVVLPQRIDRPLLDWLTGLPWPTVVVIHVNHANEIDDAVRHGLRSLRASGVTLLNQSVLLGGVNDSLPALSELSEALFAAGVLPYYLHLLDPVQGAAHFAVADSRARDLMEQLHCRLPGYLVPRLVRERPGAPYKQGMEAAD